MAILTRTPTNHHDFFVVQESDDAKPATESATEWTQRAELEAWAARKRREMVWAFRHWLGALIAAKFGDRDFQNRAIDKLIVHEEARAQQWR